VPADLLGQRDPLTEVYTVPKPIRIQSRCVGIDLSQVDYRRIGLSSLSRAGLCLGLGCRVMQDVVNDLEIREPLHLQLV
jgi:hypothetical protein